MGKHLTRLGWLKTWHSCRQLHTAMAIIEEWDEHSDEETQKTPLRAAAAASSSAGRRRRHHSTDSTPLDHLLHAKEKITQSAIDDLALAPDVLLQALCTAIDGATADR